MRRRAWHWILPPFRVPVVLAGYCHCGLGLPLSHVDTGPARVHNYVAVLPVDDAAIPAHGHTTLPRAHYSQPIVTASRPLCMYVASRGGTPE